MIKHRIGYFIETGLAGGAEEIMFRLASLASNEIYEPVVFHFRHDWIKAQCDAREIKSVEISFERKFKSLATLPLFAIQFAGLLRKENVHLLHSHLFGPIVGGGLAAFLAGIPHIATLHDIYMIEEKPLRKWQLRFISLLGTKYVAVSKNMEHFYTLQHGLPKKNIRTIYNYCDLNEYPAESEEPEKIKIFVVGRLIELKRVDRVIDVFLTLAPRFKNIELTIIGEGEAGSDLRNRVPEHMRKRVLFLGRQENVEELLAAADIFVQYSQTEGLSVSILEAIAAGLPVVVSDVGGNSELVEHENNGFLVSPDNSQDLADHLEILIVNKSLRATMGKNSLERAKNIFSRARFVSGYFSLYSSLLGLEKI